MSYTPEPLTTPIVLIGGYTPPALSVPILLGAEVVLVEGEFLASLAAPSLSLTGAVTGYSVYPATLTATLPASAPSLAFAALIVPIHQLAFTATLPAAAPVLALIATGDQIIDLPDADGPGIQQGWQQGLSTANPCGTPWQAMQPARAPCGVRQTMAEPIRVGDDFLHQHGLKVQPNVSTAHQHGLPLRLGYGIPAAEAIRLQRPVIETAAQGLKTVQATGVFDAETIKLRNRRELREQDGLNLALRLTVGHHQAMRPTATRRWIPWAQMIQLPVEWRFYVPAELEVLLCGQAYTVRSLHCRVVLHTHPVAQPPCGGLPGIIVPVQEVYVVINSFFLIRADNNQAIDALDFSATLDADSWGWSWSATVPAAQESRVRSTTLGDFVELIATLNGTALRLVVERLARSRRFGSSTIKISGRGRAAWLAEPHSPIITVMNTESRTAQQLLNDALTFNNVSIGWTVDWQLEDWSVPAGLWSYTGTYLGAATRIAESGGGYVQADNALQTLHILPYYPVAPWDWAAETPDIILPEDVCLTEELEWQDKPAYNAVWIVGGASGRRDQVIRAGTAGDVAAPTVVDPLATATAMTRQRGLRVIADTGRQVRVSLSLPILAETGIIQPGQLIEYRENGQTYLGLSRSVSVSYQFPKAQQIIQVETHELEPV
jgi:hypothetical protein